jgi:hypothetical protein
VISPQSLTYKQKLGFPLIARFANLGYRDLDSTPVRLQVRRCHDNSLAFSSDGIIPFLSFTANDVDFSFAPSQAGIHINDLLPGCYNLLAIARFAADGDRTNDTAISTFAIEASSNVDETELTTLQFGLVTQNNDLLSITYSAPLLQSIDWCVYNINGVVLRSGQCAASGIHSRLDIQISGFPTGGHVIELRSREDGVAIRRIVNIVR